MKLKHNPEYKAVGIPEELGIPKEREIELMHFLFDMHREILSSTTAKNLTAYYERIAEACNTLEEYTMCLHLFIFYLSRHGILREEKEDYERRIKTITGN